MKVSKISILAVSLLGCLPARSNPIAPTLGPNNTVTWGNPPYSHKLFTIDMSAGDVFYWTDGDDKPNADGTFPYHKDGDYGSFTAAKTGQYQFKPPKDGNINDYHWEDKKGNTLGGITFAAANGIQQFSPLINLPGGFVLPWIADTGSGANLYEAVDLAAYIANNRNGFLNGNYQTGDSLDSLGLSIVNGQIPGVAGLYFATSELGFDRNSLTGIVPLGGPSTWLNSADYESRFGPLGIIGTIRMTDTPEPNTWGELVLGSLLLCCGRRVRRWDRLKNTTSALTALAWKSADTQSASRRW